MNIVEFQRLQDAVQWAVDVHDNPPKEGVTWDQGTWFNGALDGEVQGREDYHYVDVVCDSSCCIAGNVVLQEGDKFVVPYWNIGSLDNQGQTIGADYCLTKDGDLEGISQRAQELLGINGNDALLLFAGENDIDQVIDIATDIADHYGHTLNIIRNRTRKQVLA